MKTILLLITLLLPLIARAQITWDGSTSGNWNTSANWDLVRVPNTSEQVIFPAAGLNKAMLNNRPAGTGFAKFNFSGSGYSLTGNSLTLSDPAVTAPTVSITHTTGTTSLNLPIVIGESTVVTTVAGSTLTLNSLADIDLGANGLTLTSNNLIDVNSTISGTGSVTIKGNGVVRYDAAQTYTGLTSITDSVTLNAQLILTNSLAGSVSIGTGGLLRGTGTVSGDVAVAGGIDPGDTGAGRLTISGNLTFNPVATTDEAIFNLVSTAPGTGYDQIRVGGTVTTGGAHIALLPAGAFPLGTTFTLIDKTSAGAITNSSIFFFSDGTTISEGSIKVVGVNAYQFSYVGGDGNDFTATVVRATLGGQTFQWDGGDTTDLLWSSAANWSSDVLPTAGQSISFGQNATTDVATINDLGGNFGRIQFTGSVGGFSIAPQTLTNFDLTLSHGIQASHGGATCSVNNDLVLALTQMFSLTGSAGLTIGSGTSTQLNGFDLELNSTPLSGTPILAMNAGISGTGNIIKSGPGLVTLGGTGTSSNSYTGTTTVSRGELRLNRTTITAPANCIPGDVIIGGGSNPALLTTTVAEKIADTSTITLNGNGSFLPGANETIGSLILSGGNLDATTHTLALTGSLTNTVNATVNGSGLSFTGALPQINVAAGTVLEVNSAVSSTNVVTKLGTGMLKLWGAASFGSMTITAGTVEMNGDGGQGGSFVLQPSGTLEGEGICDLVNAAAGGTLLTNVNADLQMNDLTGGTTAFYRPNLTDGSAIQVFGTVALGNMRLDPIATTVLPVGTTRTILRKFSAGLTTSRFANVTGTVLNEGTTFSTAFGVFRISYAGGDGNDVTLTSVLPAITGTNRVWDGGGGADSNWMTAANWVGDVAPLPGDDLEFAAVHVASFNNFPAGMTLGSIRFTAAASTTTRSISGNVLVLLGNLSSSIVDGGSLINISPAITFLNAATVTNIGQRQLRLLSAITAQGATLTFMGNSSNTQTRIICANSGVIGGTAKLIVDGNVSGELGTLSHTFTGGSEVNFGTLTGTGNVLLAGNLTIGDGTHAANAILSGNGTGPGKIVVNARGGLTAAGLTADSLTVNGTAANPVSVSATSVFLTNELSAGVGNTLTLTTLSAPGLVQNGATLSFTSIITVPGVVRVQSGTLTVQNGSQVGSVVVEGGSFSAPGTLGVAGNITVQGGALTAGILDFTPGPLHGFDVTTSATVATLGGSGFTDLVEKTGSGILTVNTNLQCSIVRVSGGIFRNNSSNVNLFQSVRPSITLNGGELQGTGTMGDILATTVAGSQVSPGASPGRISTSSIIVGNSQVAQFNFEITSVMPATGYDQITLDGLNPVVSLGATSNATVQLAFAPTFTAPIGTELILIDKRGANPMPTPFSGKPQGFTETVNGISVRYSYTGGDGNDFSVTLLTAPPAGEFRVWDGGGADANWMTAQNWEGDVAPVPGDALRFPAGALQLTNNNNFPADTPFGRILMEAGYTLNGNNITLRTSLEADSSAAVVVNMALSSSIDPLISLTGTGSLTLNGALNLGASSDLTLRRTGTGGELGLTQQILGGLTVTCDGIGTVRYNHSLANTHAGSTIVRRGLLRLGGNGTTHVAQIPHDLVLGGGGGPAAVENPGRRIAERLIVETGGTHILTGATPLEDITELVLKGGGFNHPNGATLIVYNALRAQGNTAAVLTTPFFWDAPAGGAVDTIDVETGSSLRMQGSFGTFSGSNLRLRKTGAGPVFFPTAIGTNIVRYEQEQGLTVIAGAATDTSPTLNVTQYQIEGGSLTGTGVIGGPILAPVSGTGTAGGLIAPGSATTGTGIGRMILGIPANGTEHSFIPDPNNTIDMEIGGTAPGTQYDIIQVQGTVDLNRCKLQIHLINGFEPTIGQKFTVVMNLQAGNNPSAQPLTNPAGADLPEGSLIDADGYQFSISYVGGTLSSLTDDVELTVVAKLPTPEIALELPAGTELPHQSTVDFGPLMATGKLTRTFTIRNKGIADLQLTGGITPVKVSGGTVFTFLVLNPSPATVIAPGQTTTFVVQFSPPSVGFHSATLTIPNNDPNENPTTITLTGTGTPITTRFSQFQLNAGSATTPAHITLKLADAPPNTQLNFQASNDLTNWTILVQIHTKADGTSDLIGITDVAAQGQSRRFYRFKP